MNPTRMLVFLCYTTALAACSNSPEKTPTSHFYEYDGRVINLNNIRLISTQANINLSVTPRADAGPAGSETRAIWEAHREFCDSRLPQVGYAGGINGSVAAAHNIKTVLIDEISSEVLTTCAISIESSASISFDNLTVGMASGSFILSPVKPADSSEAAAKQSARAEIASNLTEPSEWQKEFDSVRQRLAR